MNIQIAITPDFLQAHGQLPTKIQPKVWGAVQDFQNTPKSTGLNYEKLKVLDKSLRSIRVTNNYRIIMGVDNDNIHYLFHVNTHDDAYDWGRNKRFTYDALKQRAFIYTIPKGVEIEGENTNQSLVENRLLFDNCTDKQLVAIGVPKEWIPYIRKIKDNDQLLDLLDKNIPEDVIDNLFHVADGEDIRNLITSLEVQAEQNKQDNLSTDFYLLTEDDDIKTILSEDFSAWRVFLHPDQQEIAFKNMTGSTKVTGGAGTGKTVVAIHRAKWLADRLDEKSKPIFFTTYTKNLIVNLKGLLGSQGIPSEHIEINNLHSQCRNLAVNLGLVPNRFGIMYKRKELEFWEKYSKECSSSFSPDFLYEEYHEVILTNQVTTKEGYLDVLRTGRKDRLSKSDRLKVWEAIDLYWADKPNSGYYSFDDLMYLLISELDANPEKKPYSHIICDEIQDFSSLELRYLRALCDDMPNDLFLVGDPLQNIYGKTATFSRSKISIKGRSKRLKINYRTTEEIKKRAVNNLKGFQFDDFESESESLKGYRSKMNGSEPTYQLYSSWEKEKKVVIEQLKDIQDRTDICLHECCISIRSRSKLEQLGEQLEELDIPFSYLENVSDLNNTKDCVLLSTFHGMKGMEFKKVFLMDVSDETIPRRSKEYEELSEAEQLLSDRSEHALLYVAMSRAVNTLSVSGNGEKGFTLWGINT